MKPFLPLLVSLVLGACGMSADAVDSLSDAGVIDTGDAAVAASVAPLLKSGVDPAIFLPTVVAGYHPTPEELATSGKSCAVDADCAITDGIVIFHCSTPYYGQAQCQGEFPPGDQVEPGVTPSCLYYECPAGYECESEAESSSVTCLAAQHNGGRDAGTHGGPH